ncbi:hypothetical protein D3C85_712250 [compost metagenome]
MQALGFHRHQFAPGQFGQAIEGEQLILWIEHQQGAHRIFQQHRLHTLRGGYSAMPDVRPIGQAEFIQQLHDYRRRGRCGVWGEGYITHNGIRFEGRKCPKYKQQTSGPRGQATDAP